MPIQVNVVSQADFNAWVASKAPKPAPVPATTPAAAAPAPAAPATPAATKTSTQTEAAKPSLKLASLNRSIGKE